MSSLKTLTVIIVAAVIFIIAQIWLAREYSIRSTKVIEQLSNIDKPEAEKARQEAVSLRIENERKSFFLLTLLANVSALVAVIAAGAGVWIAVNKHYSEKSESKYNQAASALNSLCAGLTSTSTQEQVRSITGIQHFLTNEDPSFHARAVTALATTARHEQPRVVERTLVPALELAFKHASPDVVRSVSWQGLSICGGSFDGVNLSGVDFRDSKLEDCSFRDAKLIGARFDASNLKGANFKGADLTCANLEYADLAGASLVKANLTRSKLKGARILDADFYHATLTGASELREQKWRLAKSWRTATFDEETSRYLLSKFGAKNEEDRVLMILWEYPNVVSGGGWTAAYHLISQLVAEGKSLVVLIPWRTTDVDFNVFGHDIDLICAGLPSENGGAYGTGAYSYGPPAHIVDLVEEFTDVARSLLPLLSKAKCKAIRAHDWLTFPCAENIAKELRIPWIAHYHSLESERQEMPQPGVEEIEYAAARSAAGAIAVGPATAQTLKENCGDDVRVRVIPNCFTLDTGRIKRLGRFDTKSVRFFG
ncbi:MAG: pentapeptide repeat-containing protein, partial [Pirellulaceae bacterium]|nr:pentapeptide repeat-containing protein [Pirellulaceae bacterium]